MPKTDRQAIEAMIASRGPDHEVAKLPPSDRTPAMVMARALGCLQHADVCLESDADSVPSQSLRGRVYVQIPYGRHALQWARRIEADVQAGGITEAVVLLSGGSTEARWWQTIARLSSALCLIHGRLRFPGVSNTSLSGSSVAYIGQHVDRFTTAFCDMGLHIHQLLADEQSPAEAWAMTAAEIEREMAEINAIFDTRLWEGDGDEPPAGLDVLRVGNAIRRKALRRWRALWEKLGEEDRQRYTAYTDCAHKIVYVGRTDSSRGGTCSTEQATSAVERER